MAEENLTEGLVIARESISELLDFSNMKFITREEFQNALSKVPDLRMRPEKIRDSDACQNYITRKKNSSSVFPFPNPIPTSLQQIRVSELNQVDIDWKMLTLVRPKSKLEEEVFTKIVEMERRKLKTITSEAGIIENLRKKPHVSVCAHDEKGTREIYRYQTYAREKIDNSMEEDKSADYIQQVAEMLSTSKLKGDYTKEIVKKKIKSRSVEIKREAKVKEKEKIRNKKQNKQPPFLGSVGKTRSTDITDDSSLPDVPNDKERPGGTEIKIQSSTRSKNKSKSRPKNV